MKDRNLALIVDDSELNRSMLADILSDEYDIIEAENGLEAISQFEKHQFDISLVPVSYTHLTPVPSTSDSSTSVRRGLGFLSLISCTAPSTVHCSPMTPAATVALRERSM